MQFLKTIKVFYNTLSDIFQTKTTDDGVEYIWRRGHSTTLIVIFSGMGKARYNYKKTMKACHSDLLFIRDVWAQHVSYYWYEKQSNHPELLTSSLIDKILQLGTYQSLVTIGSSKGGTAALYFGLKHGAKTIIAGAPQYYVGQYLSDYQYRIVPWQWKAVVGGEPCKQWIDILDHKLPDMISANKGTSTIIHLVYSTNEHTYPEHIVDLVKDLDTACIKHFDRIEHFNDHALIGRAFTRALHELIPVITSY